MLDAATGSHRAGRMLGNILATPGTRSARVAWEGPTGPVVVRVAADTGAWTVSGRPGRPAGPIEFVALGRAPGVFGPEACPMVLGLLRRGAGLPDWPYPGWFGTDQTGAVAGGGETEWLFRTDSATLAELN
jgi:hypothetical protein